MTSYQPNQILKYTRAKPLQLKQPSNHFTIHLKLTQHTANQPYYKIKIKLKKNSLLLVHGQLARSTEQTESNRQKSARVHTEVQHMVKGFPGGTVIKNPAASAGDAGDTGSIPGLERSPGGVNDNLLQYFAWRRPWTEEPGRLQSMGLQGVRHH